jgi:GDPmannose 4,6-dehydratase
VRALIIGVSGQDGAYLAELLLSKGYEVYGSSRDAHVNGFPNLRELRIHERVRLVSIAPSDFRSVITALTRVAPDEIYNLSGQSSVGLSFEQPVETMESIAIGTLNLLEAIRFTGRDIRFYNAGSGECFGDTDGAPATELMPFHPRSPYAVAKAAAHWEVVNYRAAYGLFACNGILFNHESPLRPERFVTRKIVAAACRIAQGSAEKVTLGNVRIRRDWGWAPEYVDAMWRMLQQPAADDYVIATGKNWSLLEFADAVFSAVGLRASDHLETDPALFRPSDLEANLGDAEKAARVLGWRPTVPMQETARRMVTAERERLRPR